MTKINENKNFFFSSDFKATVMNNYIVDKSLFIKDFIDRAPEVSLITRPRRFGKSFNMDMLKTFYEKTDEDTSVYFRNLKIWQCGGKYTSEQGKYPVIHLNFGGTDRKTWKETYNAIKRTIVNEYSRHKEELCDFMKKSRSEDFENIVKETGSYVDYTVSLRLLTELLEARYGVGVIVLIDEFEVPLRAGVDCGFASDVIRFMSGLFSAGLKDNHCLKHALLTSIGPGMLPWPNNIIVYSVLDNKFSEHYGFTEDEVREMLRDFDAEDKFDEVRRLYDGYSIGGKRLFNPYAVESYISRGFKADSYWGKTATRGELKDLFDKFPEDETGNLELLACGKAVEAKVKCDIPYDRLWDGENLYSVLLACGYLTKCETAGKEGNLIYGCERKLVVPNNDAVGVFCDEILEFAEPRYEGLKKYSDDLLDVMENRDVIGLQSAVTGFLQKSGDGHGRKENFYHATILGLIGRLGGRYSMFSDREYGEKINAEAFGFGLGSEGVYFPCIAVEFRYCAELDSLKKGKISPAEFDKTKKSLMTKSAEDALGDIEKRDYVGTLIGMQPCVLKYGVAFHGKEALAILIECVDGKDAQKVSADGSVSLS